MKDSVADEGEGPGKIIIWASGAVFYPSGHQLVQLTVDVTLLKQLCFPFQVKQLISVQVNEQRYFPCLSLKTNVTIFLFGRLFYGKNLLKVVLYEYSPIALSLVSGSIQNDL